MLYNINLTPSTLMDSYLILRGMYKTRFDHPKGISVPMVTKGKSALGIPRAHAKRVATPSELF